MLQGVQEHMPEEDDAPFDGDMSSIVIKPDQI